MWRVRKSHRTNLAKVARSNSLVRLQPRNHESRRVPAKRRADPERVGRPRLFLPEHFRNFRHPARPRIRPRVDSLSRRVEGRTTLFVRTLHLVVRVSRTAGFPGPRLFVRHVFGRAPNYSQRMPTSPNKGLQSRLKASRSSKE